MADSIEEISEKYLVLKHSDVKKHLNQKNRDELNRILTMVANARANEGKPRSNEYVVLNMDDKFKVNIFYKEMAKVVGEHPRKVRDYAVALVNTILYSKK